MAAPELPKQVRSLQVIVNATSLAGPLTGIGQYVRHLINALVQQEALDLKVFSSTGLHHARDTLGNVAENRKRHEAMTAALRILPGKLTIKHALDRARFARATKAQAQGSIYHEPNYLFLPYDGPKVLTVCDLSCFDHPQTHPLDRVRMFQKLLPECIAEADQVIAISEATKASLIQWFGTDARKISVTHLAADKRFQPRDMSAVEPDIRTFGLDPDAYILSVGTLEPRKNLVTLLNAYEGLPDDLRRRFPLVLAGSDGWKSTNIQRRVEKMRMRGDLRFLGYVPDRLMPSLLAGARLFAYPSIYEGFGLPPLEAMASGTAVVAGNKTAMPEVIGDAGVLVDPMDVEAMRHALFRMLQDDHWRETFISRGIARAGEFSWALCAQQTRQVYEKAIAC